jgi:FtsP/CotA-like multicopper oxidase with cupredoxin domain
MPEEHAESQHGAGGQTPRSEGHPRMEMGSARAEGTDTQTTGPAAREHGGGHGRMDGMDMGSSVTRPQLLSVTLLTLLALAAGAIFAAANYNLSISAEDVDGAIMPPGMVNTRDTPAEAMREMSAVDPGDIGYTAPADARGDQPLRPRIEDGWKVFDLTASVINWNILADERVAAYAINRQVPGPRIRVRQGDRLRINVRNELPESTTIHWHGLVLPNAMDGPANITQKPIEPGGRFTYEFTAGQQGTFLYHSHDAPDRQQALGLYGALIVDPADRSVDAAYGYDREAIVQLQEWTEKEGYTFPSMIMEGALPNFFTINGKAYPETEPIRMEVGEKLLVRFIGSHNNFVHPMHIHGGPFRIVQTDGEPVPRAAQWTKDTVNVGPGERYDVIWTARRPGKWLLHCHIPHHTTNNNVEEQGGGGLTTIIDVRA